MKSVKLLLLVLMTSLGLSAQYVQPMGYKDYSFWEHVNIGNKGAKRTDSSAYLELGKFSGSQKGFLLPRGNKDSVVSPAKGLVFYDIPTNSIVYYNGTTWMNISTPDLGYGVLYDNNSIVVDTSDIATHDWTAFKIDSALATIDGTYVAGWGTILAGNIFKVDSSLVGTKPWITNEINTAIAGLGASIPTFSGTAPLVYDGNGNYSIPVATPSEDGYLSSTNYSNFLTAYNKRPIALSVTGTTTKTVQLTQADGTQLSASFTDNTGSAGFITDINGDATQSQLLVTGTAGNDFDINSSAGTHTFNLPTASSTKRGALSSTDWSTFNSKVSTAQLADSIDNRVTSIARRGDSVFYYIHDTEVFAYKDSVGVGGGGSGDNNYTTSIAFNAATGDVTLARSGLSDLTMNLDGRYAIQTKDECYGLIEPGVVTWSGSGLIFDVTSSTYNINCTTYTSTASQITLDAADPSNPRIDVIAVDNTGAVVKITGDAASNPVEPQVDPATQVYLTSIHIAAGATTPTGVSNVQIYNENTEWTTSTTGSITADFNATTAPQSGTKHVSVTSSSSSARLIFANGSTLSSTNYTALKLYVRLNAVLIGSQNMYVQFYNGNSSASTAKALDAYGLVKNTTGTYQVVSVPMASFTFNSDFDNVRIWTASGSGNYYIDNIQLQAGLTPVPPTSGLTSAYTIVTDGVNNGVASGGDKLKIRTDNTLSAIVANNDNTHGDNVLFKVDSSIMATRARAQHLIDSLAAVFSSGSYSDEQSQDAIGAMVSTEFTYTDATPLLAINSIASSKISGTKTSVFISDFAAQVKATLPQSKAVTVESPTASENIALFYTDVAITVTNLAEALRGTSPSLTYQINHSTNRSAGSPNALFSSSRTATSTTGTTTTTFSDATIPAGSWVWITTSAVSGTVAEINITITYTID